MPDGTWSSGMLKSICEARGQEFLSSPESFLLGGSEALLRYSLWGCRYRTEVHFSSWSQGNTNVECTESLTMNRCAVVSVRETKHNSTDNTNLYSCHGLLPEILIPGFRYRLLGQYTRFRIPGPSSICQ